MLVVGRDKKTSTDALAEDGNALSPLLRRIWTQPLCLHEFSDHHSRYLAAFMRLTPGQPGGVPLRAGEQLTRGLTEAAMMREDR